jgi:S1-C subfamily serine protease
MSRKDFWLIVVTSSLISTAAVLFFLRIPSPPPARAGFQQSEIVTLDTPLSEQERTNISVYREFSRSVVFITSTRLEINFWLQMIPRQGTGSGFFIDRDGKIVTNNHVIEDSDQLEVILFDSSTVQAEVVGRDPVNDIAVLKIPCEEGQCKPLRLSQNTELEVGRTVLAIGNPFGLERTLTTGIISSIGRSLETEYGVLDELIQTDAAINPGNSGGPLLNTRGEVIGVNTAIVSRSGESAGIGFAVSVETLNRILPDLLEYGYVLRAWIGISGRPLSRRLADYLGVPVEEGFLVERVAQGSSGEVAGLRGGNRRVFAGNRAIVVGGDVLVELDGQPVSQGRDILRVIESKKPGDRMVFVYYRGSDRIEREVTLVGREEQRRRFRF